MRPVLLTLVLLSSTVACDQATKAVAVAALEGGPVAARTFDSKAGQVARESATLIAKANRAFGRGEWFGRSPARFRVRYAENPGAFLGLGRTLPESARRAIFVGLTGILLLGGATVLFRRRMSMSRLQLAAASLFIGGGLGNLIDRTLRSGGRVVDFLQFEVGPLRTGIFNVADVALMVALGLWVVAELRPRTEAVTE